MTIQLLSMHAHNEKETSKSRWYDSLEFFFCSIFFSHSITTMIFEFVYWNHFKNSTSSSWNSITNWKYYTISLKIVRLLDKLTGKPNEKKSNEKLIAAPTTTTTTANANKETETNVDWLHPFSVHERNISSSNRKFHHSLYIYFITSIWLFLNSVLYSAHNFLCTLLFLIIVWNMVDVACCYIRRERKRTGSEWKPNNGKILP